MGNGMMWAALAGGANTGIKVLEDREKRADEERKYERTVEEKRAHLMWEMKAKLMYARQEEAQARTDKAADIDGRLSANADAALSQRYAEPVPGDMPLTDEQLAAQSDGMQRRDASMDRDRAAYERDPRNRLRASTEAGYTEPDVLAKLDSRDEIASARLESQQETARVRAQSDAERQLSKVELAMAKIDAQRQARPPTGYRENQNGDLEAIPGGPADQKKTGAFNADTAQLAGSTDGLNRLASSANSLLNHPGLPGIVGISGKFPNIPGGDAANAAAQMETLKSQIGFGVLQAMRDSSKTGGALGAVSDAEGKRLEANLAALSQAQSLDQFKASLSEIINYAEGAKGRLRDSFNIKYNDASSAPPSTGTGRPPRVGSRQELDALPSGTTFTAPDGSIRRKP